MQHWSFNFMAEILICACLRKMAWDNIFSHNFPFFGWTILALPPQLLPNLTTVFVTGSGTEVCFNWLIKNGLKKSFQIKPRCHYLLPCNSNDNEDIRERLQKRGTHWFYLYFLRHDNHSDQTKKSDAENIIFNSYFVFYHKSLRIKIFNIQYSKYSIIYVTFLSGWRRTQEHSKILKNLKNCDFAVHNLLCSVLCFMKCSIPVTLTPYKDNSSSSLSKKSPSMGEFLKNINNILI